MKKYIILITCILFMATGCFGTKNFDDDVTYTTLYPIEYVTNEIYGDYSTIKSIYPDGVNTNKYKLTNKLKKEYSRSNTLIYNGLSDEKNIAVDFLNLNKKIQIIDSMQGMTITNSYEELWLDPSSYLMIAQNIKNGLLEYNDNIYTKDDINKKYDDFKVNISELDVELNLLSKNSNTNTLIVTDDMFKYLEKYNINIISLDPNSNNIDKAYAKAAKAMDEGDCSYVFVKKGEKLNNNVENLEWCSAKYNTSYGDCIQRRANSHRGKKHRYSEHVKCRKITQQFDKLTGNGLPKPDITEPPGMTYLKFLNNLYIPSSSNTPLL